VTAEGEKYVAVGSSSPRGGTYGVLVLNPGAQGRESLLSIKVTKKTTSTTPRRLNNHSRTFFIGNNIVDSNVRVV
jgi:hypothetical protein